VPDATSERRPTGAATSNARGGCSPISRTCFGFSVSGRDGIGLVFVHVRPPPAVGRLLELPREHEVFSEFPAEATPDGRPRVVLVGETNAALQAAPDDTPPELSVSVERIGPYAGTDDPAAVLTDRQREVLDVALELGYYEVPRRATHGDVAERLGLSTATVGEHLQKIEARVFAAFAG
jgi:DNA-binding CsgD family transcriptional regulator